MYECCMYVCMYVCQEVLNNVCVWLFVSRKIEKYASVRKELLRDIEDIHADLNRADKVLFTVMYVCMYVFTEHRRSTATNKTLVHVCMYVCMY